jgi:hypothetical protein
MIILITQSLGRDTNFENSLLASFMRSCTTDQLSPLACRSTPNQGRAKEGKICSDFTDKRLTYRPRGTA